MGFHNHSSHHVLAVYALGASPELIKDVYNNVHLPHLLPIPVSPNCITEKDFAEHLGDEKYYDAYLAFFTDYLQHHSPTEALERFIFSPSYNFVSDPEVTKHDSSKHPQMLNRLIAGLIHPFIHLGYGFEFGLLGQVAEGLAQAAVHKVIQSELVPPSYFATSAASELLSNLTSGLSLAASDSNLVLPPEKRPTFAFHRRIRDDPAFRVELPSALMQRYPAAVKAAGSAIHNLVQEWTREWLAGTRSDADAEVRLRGMVEEVIWGNVVWYGVGGWASRGDSGRAMNADFFLAHLVTSSIFLPGFILDDEASPFKPGALPFATRLLLLQTYLSAAAAWRIIGGSHTTLPIADFYAATNAQLFAPARTNAGGGALRSPGSAWTRIVPSALQGPDEHTPKIARALADFARRWGMRPPGYFSPREKSDAGLGLPLEGIERLDGTLFVRAAGLTLDRLGWVNEGEEAGCWDMDGRGSSS